VGLTAGLGLVQLALTTSGNGKLGSSGAAMTVGLAAVLLSCGTSGVAGVYSEKLVKSSPSKLWGLNIQMSFFGFLLSLNVLIPRDVPMVLFYYGF
jgi:UDP-sugar transporter A1/2/3